MVSKVQGDAAKGRKRKDESGAGKDRSRPSPVKVGVEAVQRALMVAAAQLGLVEIELMGAQDYLIDSPDRAAMEEGWIPSDVNTAVQELLECVLKDDLRSLRRRLEEAAFWTAEDLRRHWEDQQAESMRKGQESTSGG